MAASNFKHEIRHVKGLRGCVEVCRRMLIRLRTAWRMAFVCNIYHLVGIHCSRRDSSSLNVLVDRVDSLSMVV